MSEVRLVPQIYLQNFRDRTLDTHELQAQQQLLQETIQALQVLQMDQETEPRRQGLQALQEILQAIQELLEVQERMQQCLVRLQTFQPLLLPKL